jgi:hypothetical protein
VNRNPFSSIGIAAAELAVAFNKLTAVTRAVNRALRNRPRSGYVPSPGGMQRWRHRQLIAGRRL